MVAGIALLVGGADLLVRGAVTLASAARVPVALRGQNEIALGNVIGSNIMNILAILGATALIAPLTVAAQMVASDLWWMLAFSLILYPMMRTGRVLGRRDGALLVGGYVTYLTLLILAG